MEAGLLSVWGGVSGVVAAVRGDAAGEGAGGAAPTTPALPPVPVAATAHLQEVAPCTKQKSRSLLTY